MVSSVKSQRSNCARRAAISAGAKSDRGAKRHSGCFYSFFEQRIQIERARKHGETAIGPPREGVTGCCKVNASFFETTWQCRAIGLASLHHIQEPPCGAEPRFFGLDSILPRCA